MAFHFLFLQDFCKLNKTPSNGTCWDFILTGGFFRFHTFSMPVSLHPGFSGPWSHSPALNSTLATFGCSILLFFHQVSPSHFYRECCSFERAFCTHRRFLTCAPSPYIGTFCDIFLHVLWWGQEYPIQDPPLCMPSQSCPFRLAHGLKLLIL